MSNLVDGVRVCQLPLTTIMRLKNPFKDVRTIKALLSGAERKALDDGEERAGAEHLLLAALDLPDGTARRAFERAGADPDALPAAIADAHASALQAVGIAAPADAAIAASTPAPAPPGPLRTGATCQSAFQRATELSRPGHLLGAHVVAAVAEIEEGTTPRALRALGVDRETLRAAALAELQAG